MASNDLGGVWRTVGGRRIFIKDGEDLETAMKKSDKFNSKGEKLELTNNDKEKIYNQLKDNSHIIKNYDDWKIKTQIDDNYDYIFNVMITSPSADDNEIYHYNIKTKKITRK